MTCPRSGPLASRLQHDDASHRPPALAQAESAKKQQGGKPRPPRVTDGGRSLILQPLGLILQRFHVRRGHSRAKAHVEDKSLVHGCLTASDSSDKPMASRHVRSNFKDLWLDTICQIAANACWLSFVLLRAIRPTSSSILRRNTSLFAFILKEKSAYYLFDGLIYF